MAKIKVAVTGGIGSGKSAAINCIRSMGYPVFSCDEIYKEVIQSKAYIERIKNAFPDAVLGEVVNREILSKLVFDDANKREILNNIAHPLILQTLFAYMNECESELVFAEVPLLFEGNLENSFDKIIVVQRDKAARIAAIQKRNGFSAEEIEKRMQAQFDYQSKENANRLQKNNVYLLSNNEGIDELNEKIKMLVQNLQS